MSKGTTILLGADDVDRDDLMRYVRLSREVDDRETQLGILAVKLKARGEAEWLKLFGAREVAPETPFKIVEANGASVSFVVTDKTGGFALKPEQETDLTALLGSKIVGEMVDDRVRLELNDKVLVQPSACDPTKQVVELVADRLKRIPAEMVAAGEVTAEQAQALFSFAKVRQLRPKLLGTLAVRARVARVRILDILGVLGPAVQRTIKA
jgi:hypothetical protein